MKFILSSLAILVISLTLLLCFVILKDKKSSKNTLLTISSSNITMQVGQEVTNFYVVSDENAEIKIQAQDESIFLIENNKLLAIKAGSTTITIFASLDGDRAKTSFLLTIERDGYSFVLTPIQNCSFSENVLLLTDNACQFSVEIYDKMNTLYTPQNMSYSATNNAIIIKEVTSFVLVSQENCVVTINYPDIDFSVVFHVVKA